ncbi:MAG: isoprenylcysteine carboxylmethyltransferase family protein [Deltaproteobacteria bacterium]|nr:isoprenylcysteine carboxylmethyltransferase family protein [Deltaproteobacteria bacterium]
MSRTKNGQAVARTVEIAILLVLPILFHYLFPILIIVPKPYTYLGIALMLPGLALAIWAAMTFQRVGTSFQLHGESSVLTTSGPFRISRNPMYLAMLIWLVGLAVLLGSLTVFLFPILFLMLANFLMIPLEERNMEQMFGGQYTEYKQCVRRWV